MGKGYIISERDMERWFPNLCSKNEIVEVIPMEKARVMIKIIEFEKERRDDKDRCK